jgi:hypothetical protein
MLMHNNENAKLTVRLCRSLITASDWKKSLPEEAPIHAYDSLKRITRNKLCKLKLEVGTGIDF